MPTDDYTKFTFGDVAEFEAGQVNFKNVDELFKMGVNTPGINFSKYDNIPVECTGREVPAPIAAFDENVLAAFLLENIRRADYKTPTPVQKYSIPIGLAGRDMMACAQTGSGKTGGFLFPALTKIGSGHFDAPRGYRAFPRVLILAPTRELASQIHIEALKFSYGSRLKAAVIYGGVKSGLQARDLERGCDVLIATPGRLIDFMDSGKISLSCVQFLVFDEADRMLDMGFEKQIRDIVDRRDLPRQRNSWMFSATFPEEIQQLAADFMHDYLFLKVGRVGSTTDSITQIFKWVDDYNKRDEVVKDLQAFPGKTLVFTETKRDADQLARFLYGKGLGVTSIHGDRSQAEREAALLAFRQGRITILVATDVASRGLDIDNVAHVINYDLPAAVDDYVHRIGRTGRAGNTGIATSYFTNDNVGLGKKLVKLLREANQIVPPWLDRISLETPSSKGGRGRGGRSGGSGAFRSGGYGSGFAVGGYASGPMRRDRYRDAPYRRDDRDRDYDREWRARSRSPSPARDGRS